MAIPIMLATTCSPSLQLQIPYVSKIVQKQIERRKYNTQGMKHHFQIAALYFYSKMLTNVMTRFELNTDSCGVFESETTSSRNPTPLAKIQLMSSILTLTSRFCILSESISLPSFHLLSSGSFYVMVVCLLSNTSKRQPILQSILFIFFVYLVSMKLSSMNS